MAEKSSRRSFLKTLTEAGALSVIGSTAGSMFLPENKGREVSLDEFLELRGKNRELEAKLADLTERYANLVSYLIVDEGSLDFTKYEYYDRMKGFEPYLDAAIKKYSHIFPVSKLIMVLIAETESSLGRNKFSSQGAAWLWQFIPETARRMGLHVKKNRNYEKSSSYRGVLRSSRRKISKLVSELDDYAYQKSGRNEFSDDRELADYLSHRQDGRFHGTSLEHYDSLWEELKDAVAVHASHRNKQGKYLSRYISYLKKVDSLPYAEKIKIDERADVEKSTYAAVEFMAGLLRRTNGNYFEALSMYNADDTKTAIMPYSETVKYIDKILKRYMQLKGKLTMQTFSQALPGSKNPGTSAFSLPD